MPNIAPALMVDGYNIVHYWPKSSIFVEEGDMEKARMTLVEELDTVSAMRGWTITVRTTA